MELNNIWKPLSANINWVKAIVIWLVMWMLFIYISHLSKAIVYIAVGLLAAHTSHIIVQVLVNWRQIKYIEDTHRKAVLITGCDSGFGFKLALRLDAMGFKVFAGCLFPEGEGASSIVRLASERLKVVHLDVTEDDVVKKAENFVRKEMEANREKLWALVNNAGVAALTEIEWCPLEIYQKMFDVNTMGVIRVTKQFLPILRLGEDGGRVVIVTSLAGRYTFPGFSAYSMSKHGAVSFADALRLEMVKWNVSVHTIEPTLYSTNICQESVIQSMLDKNWQDCPEPIKKSYGKAYLEDFKTTIHKHLSRAKPIEKADEVVDDMVDAVAGEHPLSRYVPSLETQLKCQLLSSLPTKVLDYLLVKGTPKTPPADKEGIKKQQKFVF